MKQLIIIFSFISIYTNTFAQDIRGAWQGQLNVPGAKLTVVFHITQQAGTYTATMDSPDQNVYGLPTDNITFISNKVTINMVKQGITYTGTYQADSSKITGTFKQGTGSFPLVLNSVTTKTRPQDPVDFPYLVEDVSFEDKKAGCTLAGTLTLPKNKKASKIVILITGSGPQNRNEELMNHRPFLVWSDWLTRQGIGVLRYDDRGIAKSTGNFNTATTADFADDAEAAVTYLLSRTDTKGMEIGLMGHSEGGMIAPIVAARNKTIGFIVLLAGPAVPITQLMLKQRYELEKLNNSPPEALASSQKINKGIFDYINANSKLSTDELKTGITNIIITQGAIKDDKLVKVIQEQSAAISTPWFRYFIKFDPTDYLTKVTCPVLAVNGTLDVQVDAATNLTAIKADLTKAGNKNFSTIPLDGLNHLLQKATTGSLAEYSTIEETVDPLALTTVSQWVIKLK
jgi:alpha/beta superfamily hydrolase